MTSTPPLPTPQASRLARWLAVLASTLLAACSHAPGMNMDTSSEELKSRADLLTIDLPTVLHLRAEARRKVITGAVMPASFKAGAGSFEYLVAAGDVLRITVWNQPELTNPSNTSNELSGRVVNSDGTLFFPHVGAFKAAGLRVQDIREHITQGLEKIIKQPQVDVSVLQYRSQRIYVSGEVRTPGTVAVTDVPPDMTEVIARAGGTTSDADLSSVTITRGGEQLRVDLQALYYGGDLRGNVRLRHGDVVNVPERRSAKVFVTGEVIRPTTLLMPRGPLTLADALADAGGVNPLSANAGQIFVLRGGADSRARVYHLNAASADALLLADQFMLNARDVVYVDTAPVVRWARVMSNVLASATFVREALNDTTRALPR